jgi:GAF domain-containing protein
VANLVPHFHKCVAVPIIRSGEVEGVLTVYSVRPAEFTADDASAVQAVADQLALNR